MAYPASPPAFPPESGAPAMHVAHVNFAKGFRGGERQTLNLIEGLARAGVRQTLVCRPGSALQRRAAELGVATLGAAHPLLGHLAPPAFDLIHVHEARGAYWAAVERALRRTPYLITRRILHPISSGAATQGVYRGAAALVGVSGEVARILAGQTGRAVATIFDSCTVAAAAPAAVAALREKIGGQFVVGHVGALIERQKGQSVLIEAFRRFAAERPGARLLLLGEGEDRAAFEAQAGGDARIVFAGFQDDVAAWMGAMDIFAFPSREEGLGSSVLDAMQLGLPVVAAAVGGLPELTGASERGLLLDGHDPADWCAALRRLADEPALRAALAGAGRRFAAENDVAAMSRRYLALYRDIVAGAAPKP